MNPRVIVFSLLIVAIAYANAVPYPFVQSDDFLIVASNPGIRSITPLRFLSQPYWAGYKFGGIYRPLSILSFSIDYAIWHRWAPGYRLTNLLLHVLNGCLVFSLASMLIGSYHGPLVDPATPTGGASVGRGISRKKVYSVRGAGE